MIIPNFKTLPDFMLIQYANRLDGIMSFLVNLNKDNTIMYKLALILQKQIDYELDTRLKALGV